MKAIVYQLPGQPAAVFKASLGERLCASAVVNGQRVVFNSPIRFDRISRRYDEPRMALFDPTWAESEEEMLARVTPRVVPTGAVNIIVDDAAIPTDRTFRSAFVMGEAGVNVDMVKAREVKRDELRLLRKPLLEAEDAAYMRALEDGASTQDLTAIVTRKQVLRDVTDDPAIEAAETPEELKAVLPDVLKSG